jgi:lipopolysaccharide export system permease protein
LTASTISVLGLAWNENLVPYFARQFQWVNNVEIRKRTPRGILSDREIWYRGSGGIYNIEHVDHATGTLYGLTIYQMDRQFGLHTIVELSTSQWTANGWTIGEALEHIVHASGNIETRRLRNPRNLIPETLGDFVEVHREPEELSYRELRARIGELEDQGVDSSRQKVDLEMKLAVPFASFILAWVGIPLAARAGRNRSIAAALGVGLAVGAGYWILLALSKSLGEASILTAIPAAWSANLIYLLLGGVLLLGGD